MSGLAVIQGSQAGHPGAPQAVFLAYGLVVFLCLLLTRLHASRPAPAARIRRIWLVLARGPAAQRQPAVDGHGRTGDVARSNVAEQGDGHSRDLVRKARYPQRDPGR